MRRGWRRRRRASTEDAAPRETAQELLAKAGRAKARIAAGLAALDEPLVFEAFRIANRAVATALRQRWCHGQEGAKPADAPAPTWRPFQIAFLLLNLVGAADAEHEDRRTVDLLFFPSGGGKTEAYLGLAAFVIVLRRLCAIRRCNPPASPC